MSISTILWILYRYPRIFYEHMSMKMDSDLQILSADMISEYMSFMSHLIFIKFNLQLVI